MQWWAGPANYRAILCVPQLLLLLLLHLLQLLLLPAVDRSLLPWCVPVNEQTAEQSDAWMAVAGRERLTWCVEVLLQLVSWPNEQLHVKTGV